jgi:hypothetical protein
LLIILTIGNIMKKSLKFISLRSFLILLLGIGIDPILIQKNIINEITGGLIFAGIIWFCFWPLARMRCPKCNAQLSTMYAQPAYLMFLFMLEMKCKECGESYK